MSDAALHNWDLDRPSPSLRGRLFGHVIMTACATALVGATATLVALALRDATAAPPRAAPAPSPMADRGAGGPAPDGGRMPWREIVKPVHIYNLEARVFAGAPLAYTARLHAPGGGREDVITLGRLDGVKPAIHLRMFRRAGETPSRVPFYAAVAQEAAQVGLSVAHSGLPGVLATRFGAADVADVALAASDNAIPLPCEAVRLILDRPGLSITGLACGTRAAPLSRRETGCLIERLDVASARDDRELVDFFAASELRRNAACDGARLAPDTVHAAWLDDAADAGGKAQGGGKVATSRRSLRRR